MPKISRAFHERFKLKKKESTFILVNPSRISSFSFTKYSICSFCELMRSVKWMPCSGWFSFMPPQSISLWWDDPRLKGKRRKEVFTGLSRFYTSQLYRPIFETLQANSSKKSAQCNYFSDFEKSVNCYISPIFAWIVLDILKILSRLTKSASVNPASSVVFGQRLIILTFLISYQKGHFSVV